MRKRKKLPLEQSRPKRTKALNPSECVIDTEGVQYVINWDTFPVMGFVFIRCIETDKVLTAVRAHAYRQGVGVALRVGIRNGYWGVGVWRTK